MVKGEKLKDILKKRADSKKKKKELTHLKRP